MPSRAISFSIVRPSLSAAFFRSAPRRAAARVYAANFAPMTASSSWSLSRPDSSPARSRRRLSPWAMTASIVPPYLRLSFSMTLSRSSTSSAFSGAAGPPVPEADERIGGVLEQDGGVLEARPEPAEGLVVGGEVPEDGLEPGEAGHERILAEVGQVEGLVDEAGDLLGVPEDLPFAQEAPRPRRA